MNIKKAIYIVVGIISLGLGAAGAALPVLPAFPFLLLAGYCFTRSSEKLNNWFLSTKLYKNNLEGFVAGRGMTKATKIRVISTVTLVMGFSLFMMRNAPVYAKITLGIVWVGHILYFIYGVKNAVEQPAENVDVVNNNLK